MEGASTHIGGSPTTFGFPGMHVKSLFPSHCISFWLNDRCITPSLLISSVNWYNQKPFIGLIGAGQMYDVCAILPAAGETLEIFWMGS
jgi:hypothetical protein